MFKSQQMFRREHLRKTKLLSDVFTTLQLATKTQRLQTISQVYQTLLFLIIWGIFKWFVSNIVKTLRLMVCLKK